MSIKLVQLQYGLPSSEAYVCMSHSCSETYEQHLHNLQMQFAHILKICRHLQDLFSVEFQYSFFFNFCHVTIDSSCFHSDFTSTYRFLHFYVILHVTLSRFPVYFLLFIYIFMLMTNLWVEAASRLFHYGKRTALFNTSTN